MFILGYLLNKETGAVIYNIGHTYSVVVCIGILAWVYHQPIGLSISLIWAAHIGFDRLLGYGLKYTSGFKNTHLQGIDLTKVPEDITRP